MGVRFPRRLHHVGITVNDLPRSVRFWAELTGGTASEIKTVDAPHLSTLLDYRDVRLQVATVKVSETLTIELLRYVSEPADPYDPGTAHPGNVHVCFDVDDMSASWEHAVRCGAVPVGDGPVDVPSGGQLAYLRTVDGASIELRAIPI
ncbi:VOC family protein [Tenggerimyces flavus]|uniref:VOC family protein n=1 Tax=Tenggerimyces flavus TaxID=1708749 RepID=A0ABV7YJ32_9ACTN|nr:VOC family protein [Tenggerimyces flavus]MBM7789624.1 catechol 2,3-dioxygenase-like lactoylglutathione lyase family enzyme [Tenggerimyces flavus]